MNYKQAYPHESCADALHRPTSFFRPSVRDGLLERQLNPVHSFLVFGSGLRSTPRRNVSREGEGTIVGTPSFSASSPPTLQKYVCVCVSEGMYMINFRIKWFEASTAPRYRRFSLPRARITCVS